MKKYPTQKWVGYHYFTAGAKKGRKAQATKLHRNKVTTELNKLKFIVLFEECVEHHCATFKSLGLIINRFSCGMKRSCLPIN